MRKVMMILGILALLASCNNGVDKHPKMTTAVDSASYNLGFLVGSDIANNSTEGMKLKKEFIFAGLAAGFEMDTTLVGNREAAIQVWNNFLNEQRKAKLKEMQEKAEKTKAEGKKFLEENKKKAGVITTDSGLQYEILKQGEGKVPQKGNKVSVHYVGTFLDGKEFDSSVKRKKPFEFEVGKGRVIKGWDEVLQLMPIGSKWKVYIPSDLAYGDRERATIPAGSLLVFEIELLDIKKK